MYHRQIEKGKKRAENRLGRFVYIIAPKWDTRRKEGATKGAQHDVGCRSFHLFRHLYVLFITI